MSVVLRTATKMQISESKSDRSTEQETHPTIHPNTTYDILPKVKITVVSGHVWLVEGNPIPNCTIECYFRRNTKGLKWFLLIKFSGLSDEERLQLASESDAIMYPSVKDALYYYDASKINIFAHTESSLNSPNLLQV
jgi:hypothetical protein